MENQDLETRYPALFRSGNRGIMDEFEAMSSPPPEEMIGNVYMVGESEGKVLYIVQEGGRIQIPGGKKDPGENHLETIQREMMEEAGAKVIGFNVVGAWHMILRTEKPLKPHLPHPEMYMVVGIGKVEIVSVPSNPEDSKRTTEVKFDSIERVLTAFRSADRHDLADLYQFAWDWRTGKM